MSTPAQQRAYGIAAILLAKASVEGTVEASIRMHDSDEIAATLQAFRELIVELRDRAGMVEIGDEVV
jgi:hypothetical protein